MSTRLASPLRMSLSMTSGHDPASAPVATDDRTRPFGYMYATGAECDHSQDVPQMGHYDPDSQTWVDEHGFITAGVATMTRTSCGCLKQDDACF
jgi:hypothetical protein